MLTGLPKQSPSDLQLLLPDPNDSNHDFDHLKELWFDFDTHSQRYQVERLMIQPAVGDFKIRHLASNEKATVELKSQAVSSHTHNALKIRLISALHHIPGWDMLLLSDTGDYDKSQKWYLFSRNELPEELFQQERLPFGHTKVFTWLEPEAGFFASHAVPDKPKAAFVKGMEALLDMFRTKGMYQATRRVPFSRSSKAKVRKGKKQSVEKPQRGKQEKFAGKLWRAEQVDRVLTYCMERFVTFSNPGGSRADIHSETGCILPLPYHSSARYLYSPFGGIETTFCGLGLYSVAVYLNIANIVVSDELFANDGRRPWQFRSLVEAKSQSLFLLLPRVGSEYETDKAYLVPSPLLKTKK